jgi:hypothetical protein
MEKEKVLDIIEAKALKLTDGYVKMAKLAMVELERNDMTSFVLLKHDGLREWWQKEFARVTRQESRYANALETFHVKMSAWERLTPEDRKLLGLRKPVKPKAPQ